MIGMIHPHLQDLRRCLGERQRLLGLDVGKKTIGLALSDASLTVATPLRTIDRRKFQADTDALARVIAEHDVGGLVLGLPIGMDGREGPACQSVRQFAANLLERLDVEIVFWDERLSTAAVERVLVAEADMTRKRRGEVVDKMAAAYILQGALDALSADAP
jgi:putative Holliday junction resolvase